MRDVSSEYLSQVQGNARQFGFYVKVYGNSADGDTLWLGDIISIDIVRSCSDQIQIGACMSAALTLQTKATTLFNGKGKKIEVFSRCTAPKTEWHKLGVFYVEEAVTKNGVTAVSAYDMMSRLDKRLSWIDTSRATAPVFPCTMQDMLDYICARAGFTTNFQCQDITVEKPPDGYTARELISYIAASHGANARFTPYEKLKISGYTQASKTVEYGRCYSMDIGSEYTVKGLLFKLGGDGHIYIDGTAAEYDEDADGIVEVFDPFATVGIAEYAWGKIGGLQCCTASLEFPAEDILEPGDIFTVQDANGAAKQAVVIEQSLSVSCSGGFIERISSTAESKAQTRAAGNSTAAVEKSVQKVETTVEQSTAKKLVDVQGSAANAVLAAQPGVFTGLYANKADGNRSFEIVEVDNGTFQIMRGNDRISFAMSSFEIARGGNSVMFVGDTRISLTAGNGLKFLAQTGGLGISTLMLTPPSGYGDKLEITLTDYSNESGGPSIKLGGKSIEFRSDGLYYGGRRLAFADELGG